MSKAIIIRHENNFNIPSVRIVGTDENGLLINEAVDLDGIFREVVYDILDKATNEQLKTLTSIIDMWEIGIDYRANQLVSFNGLIYRVQQCHTSQANWTPDSTAALFRLIGTEDEVTSSAPPWVQPIGGHDAYSAGDKVTYHGIVWKSNIDGNVWAPSVWGWSRSG